MKKIREFKVVPYLPEKLKPLMKIAENLWWVWNFEAIDLFRRIDVDLWRDSGHNPISFLGSLPQKALDAVKEARERVRAAIKSNGFKFPVSRVTVNLAPADTKKAKAARARCLLMSVLRFNFECAWNTAGSALRS